MDDIADFALTSSSPFWTTSPSGGPAGVNLVQLLAHETANTVGNGNSIQ